MSKDLGDAIGTAIGKAAREAAETVRSGAKSGDGLSGMKGVVAGAGLATLAPLAVKGAGKLVSKVPSPTDAAKKAGEKAGEGAKDAVGGAGGVAGKLLPNLGGGDGDSGGTKNEATGVGKGRRMPIQQAVDVAVPIDVAYNQWTQFEEWPSFMHRLERVTQEDEAHVSFKAKIWGISKEFEAEIVEQRPDERIKWKVTEGLTHHGVVSFHKLADRLTRIEVSLDIEPGSLIEKAGRGMRHAKRAVRADLHRFKAYVEMEEDASGEWRGEIEDGDVKKKRSSKASSSGARSRSKSSSSSGSRSKTSSSRSRSSSNGKGSSSGSRSGGSSRKKSRSRS
jgi:uncharacterized membrane protein